MADSLTLKMRGLAVSTSQHAGINSTTHHPKLDRPSAATTSNALPRIVPVLTKFRNPDLQKHDGPSTDAPRAALMRLAGGAPNVERMPPAGPSTLNLGKIGSPKRAAQQHTAHGVHGPAHGTAARTLTGKITSVETKKVATTINQLSVAVQKEGRAEILLAEATQEGNKNNAAKETKRASETGLSDMPFKP
jgi:hypothetical protein